MRFSKRHQDSSSASSASPAVKQPSNSSETATQDAVLPAQMSSDVRLEITQNKAIDTFIYKLINKTTGEVVRQWPTEEMVKMREYFAEQQIQLVDQKA